MLQTYELDRDANKVNQGLAVYGNKGSTDQHAYVQQLRDGINNFYPTLNPHPASLPQIQFLQTSLYLPYLLKKPDQGFYHPQKLPKHPLRALIFIAILSQKIIRNNSKDSLTSSRNQPSNQ